MSIFNWFINWLLAICCVFCVYRKWRRAGWEGNDGERERPVGRESIQYARVTESNSPNPSKSKLEYSNTMKDYCSIFRLKFFRLALNLLWYSCLCRPRDGRDVPSCLTAQRTLIILRTDYRSGALVTRVLCPKNRFRHLSQYVKVIRKY